MKLNKIIQIIEKKTFLYYNDINNHTLYIPRFVYEECKFLKIEFDSHSRIIFDRNYYSIPKDKIKELEEKSNYKGIEKILHFEKEQKLIEEKRKEFFSQVGISGGILGLISFIRS